jgi:hypothetical protein
MYIERQGPSCKLCASHDLSGQLEVSSALAGFVNLASAEACQTHAACVHCIMNLAELSIVVHNHVHDMLV